MINQLKKVIDQKHKPEELNRLFVLSAGQYRRNLPCVNLLLKLGVGINAVNAVGDTAVSQAVYCCEAIVKVLIGAGADVNIGNRINTPLIRATCIKGNIKIVQALIDAGACPNVDDSQGRTPLINAILNNDIEMLKVLMVGGAKVDFINRHGRTALLWAIQREDINIEIVKILINAGADPAIVNSVGKAALDYAHDSGNQEVIQLIEDALSKKLITL